MKILALAASNSTTSINQALVDYTTRLFAPKSEVKTLDLNDYEIPIFSPERRAKDGLPTRAQEFNELIDWADLIIISFAEYNGSYTPIFKNLMDWASADRELLWKDKDMLLMAASPGKRGAKTVLTKAAEFFPFMGANIVGTYSFPSFGLNFKDGKIVDQDLDQQLQNIVLQIEHPVAEKAPSRLVKFFDKLSLFWTIVGYSVFGLIVYNGFTNASLFEINANNIFWQTAMFAATFTLIIRPLYELFPRWTFLEPMLKWRKGVGVLSSGIVVGFWISRNFSWQDPSLILNFFTDTYWSLNFVNFLERTSEITAWTLFLISNKWLVKNFNTLWRQLQKLAYVYFLSSALLLTLVHQKEYAAVCLLAFFIIYQAWFYLKLTQNSTTASASRQSQAS